VSVTFDELRLEADAHCSFDSVSLYDGSNDESQLLGKFCTVATSPITSSGPSLFVVFQSDVAVNRGRFSLNWTFVSEDGQGIGYILCYKLILTKSRPYSSYYFRQNDVARVNVVQLNECGFNSFVALNSSNT